MSTPVDRFVRIETSIVQKRNRVTSAIPPDEATQKRMLFLELGEAFAPPQIEKRSICVDADIGGVITELYETRN